MIESFYPRNESREFTTNSRLSFANSRISRKLGLVDYMIDGQAGRSRYIRYKSTSSDDARTIVESKKIILGNRISGINTYDIPLSARPMSYESSAKQFGSYRYNDEQLAFDLGVLFGKLVSIDEAKTTWTLLHVDDAVDLADMVALVDFTAPNEENVFLAPGVEHSIVVVDRSSEQSPVDYYLRYIPDLFLDNPETAAELFQMGFSEQVEA